MKVFPRTPTSAWPSQEDLGSAPGNDNPQARSVSPAEGFFFAFPDFFAAMPSSVDFAAVKKILLTFLVAVLVSLPALAEDAAPKKVGEAYIAALTGSGSDAGKDLLLGGVTMNASMFTLENGTIVKEDYTETETKDLKGAVAMVKALDRAGNEGFAKLMGKGANTGKDEEVTMVEMSKEQTNKILAKTRAQAEKFKATYPQLAYVARANKDMYWNTKNPIRPVLTKAGATGKYTVTVHHYTVKSTEGASKQERTWPLRVVRFQGGSVDTGWKVLPAADWNAD